MLLRALQSNAMADRLAVFEKHSLRECAVCGTRFPLPKLAPGAKLKKKVAKAK